MPNPLSSCESVSRMGARGGGFPLTFIPAGSGSAAMFSNLASLRERPRGNAVFLLNAGLLTGVLWLSPLVSWAQAEKPPETVMTTLVGTGEAGNDSSAQAVPARSARLNQPFDCRYDAVGNLVFSDTANHQLKRWNQANDTVEVIAGTGRKGFSGDGGPARAAELDEPYGVAPAPDGSIYFVDRLNRRVRKIDGATGIITTVAGNGRPETSGDGGPANRAGLVEPNGLALDPKAEDLLIADVQACRIRVVDLNTGVISTFAGTGRKARDGDGGPAQQASILGARAVRVAPDGTVYILEREGNSLRAVDPRDGIITTVAGNGRKGYSGDGGPALEATFNGPKELDVSPEGLVAIVDTENQAIRLYNPKTRVVTTLAGNGQRGREGDGGPATAARLDRPHGVAFGPGGVIAISDTNNHRIRLVKSVPVGSNSP